MRSAANILWIASAVILSFASERVEGFLGPQQQHWRSERRNRSFDSKNPTAAATTISSIALPIICGATSTSSVAARRSSRIKSSSFDSESRRTWLFRSIVASTTAAAGAWAFSSQPARGNDFAPGGTLVDYKVGVTVGNPEASSSRKPDNSNVLFDRDFYFKFGTAAPWIPPGSSDFPKTIPFVKSQQRYDALKKYQDRILFGVANIRALENAEPSTIADPTAVDVYYLRPMGLLANSLLASENTGSTNELYLARWYINEILLHITDLRNATSADNASYAALRKALNSYLCLMNRAITEKVGDKFGYI